mmetsp:Transcript_35465/g.80700  ORF Transcript_35465/g.80700 Transcript_35465/m.80700 type:complete len:133 (+) Transcript_35465:2-400(+)
MHGRAPDFLSPDELAGGDQILLKRLEGWEVDGDVAPPSYPETLEGAAARHATAIARVAGRFGRNGKAVAAVSHGDAVAVFVGVCLNIRKDDVYAVPHCSHAAARLSGSCLSASSKWEEPDVDETIGVMILSD